MNTFTARFTEYFRHLKSDAVPRPPRENRENIRNDVTDENENYENINISNETEPEDIDIELDDLKKGKPKKGKKKVPLGANKAGGENNENGVNYVNTQATGAVINIVGSSNVHWGNVFINNLGSKYNQEQKAEPKEKEIKKCNLVTLLMEAKIRPEHEYIDFISKNLGKEWHRVFIDLGYTKGRIETVEYDEAKNGVSEARYKLLLDWSRNDEDGTLGRLASLLWDAGEREIVKYLAVIYKKNNKNKK